MLLSHTLSGAVPSPCQALASGFGMGPGVSPGPWPPQIFSCTVRRWGLPACGGLGTGQRTRICRCFVLWPDNAHCRLVPFAGGRCGPTARGWNVSVAFRPLVPVGSTPRGASTSGLSTTCSAWGLPTSAEDRDQTVSRRSEPSSRAALIGEQPNPWDLLQPQDATSRHRGAKPSRRYGLLGMISLLSPGYLLSVERCRVRTPAPDH